MPSVIIPACNEERVIGRCVRALMRGGRAQDELEIVVVCNGCDDATADIARRIGADVKVVETPVGSKFGALNLGDTAATRFPRFYVDADVALEGDALRRLTDQLRAGDKLAAAPRARFELAGCSWAVRAFYRINDLLPSSREGIGGSGVYALSEAGRKRFGDFPNVIADDGFVRLQFREEERVTLSDCTSTVYAPRTLAELVRIKTRSHLGTAQLRRMYPHLWQNRGTTNGGMLRTLVRRPTLWPSLAVYCLVKGVARIRAWKRLRGANLEWERDQSSRLPANQPSELRTPVTTSVPVANLQT